MLNVTCRVSMDSSSAGRQQGRQVVDAAIDGLIQDLQLQPFDHLTELGEFGQVAGTDAEQELLIVRVEDELSAQGRRMRPDRLRIMRLQIAPELIHIRLVE